MIAILEQQARENYEQELKNSVVDQSKLIWIFFVFEFISFVF